MKRPQVSMRLARIEDTEELADLAAQLGYPSTPEEILERFESIHADSDHAIFIAEADGRVIGWVHVFFYTLLVSKREAEIGGVVVDENHRGAGVGRRLMEQAETWARQRSCPSVYLRSNVIRSEAHKFYERIGYTRIKSQHALRKMLK
jgi:GNAT superfamily N-acetyltransferase